MLVTIYVGFYIGLTFYHLPFSPFTCKHYDKQAYSISAFGGISSKINSIWI